MSERKSAYAVRGFTDAGTGETFEPGHQNFEPGAYGNYKAAGLVSDEPPASTAAAAAPSRKPASKAAPKATGKGA